MEYVYQLVCRSSDCHGCMTNEFVYGTYASNIKANNQKEECEKRARESGIYDLEYEVVSHIVIK